MTDKETSRSIRAKLLLAIGSVGLGACLLLGLFTSLELRRLTLRQTNDSLISTTTLMAHNISAGLDFGMPDAVRDALSGLFSIAGIRFALVVQPNGLTFVRLGDLPPLTDLDLSPPATPQVRRLHGMLIAGAPVRDATSQQIGSLFIGYSLAQTREALQTNILWLVAITLGVAAASIFVGHSLGRRLTTPLLQLTVAARKLAAGLFDAPLEVQSNDEVGLLARTFNMMSMHLAASRNEVERSKQELEMKVLARTEELRQKNIALELQTGRALEASRLKSAFLASVSHELRTPLNGILALSEMLEVGLAGEMNEEQRNHAMMIHRSGTALLHLINDILDLSKIEAGRMEIHLSPWDVMAELRRAALEMQPLAASRGLEMRLAIPEGPRVSVDPDRVRQIVVNLVGNAIKFTERGYVEVSAVLDPGGSGLRIDVRDTGIGIAPEHVETIFQEFRQVDGSPSRRYGGTGLGLSISRRLAELMGGTIQVESAIGRGSHFRVILPAPLVDEDGAGASRMDAAA